jgi:regulation of enolase protein 1 (concanavalin A-like superfamily)/tetratricopeptide (TPR) repeat protein
VVVVACVVALAGVPLAAADWTSENVGLANGGSTTPVGADGLDIRGAGVNIYKASDSFRYVYQKITGDFDVRVRVQAVEAADQWAKAGIMVRQTTASGSVHATAFAHANGKVQFRRRPGTDKDSEDSCTEAPMAAIPIWLRLQRSGARLTGSYATDANGAAWKSLGTADMGLKDPVLVGLCVCSNAPAQPCLATFRSISVHGGAAPAITAAPPVVERAPEPTGGPAARALGEWTSLDIGGASPGTTTAVGADGFDIAGNGRDIWYSGDSFRFVYQQVSGDFDIRARLMSVENTHEWAKSGLMVRQSKVPGSPHATLFVSSQKGCVFQRRHEAGGETVSAGAGKPHSGGTWLRLMRSGKAITVHIASDEAGTQWSRVGGDSVELTDPVLVGMCVCSHADKTLCKTEFRNVSLQAESATTGDPVGDAAVAATRGTAPKLPGLSIVDSAAATARTDKPVVNEPTATAAPSSRAPAGDPKLAAALATSAAKLAAEGKQDKARDMALRALVYDEECSEALYELGKILEKDGKRVAAGDFLARAAANLARDEAANPALGVKRGDAERRVRALNPHAMRLAEALTDYALSLGAIVKRVPDSMTQEEVAERIGMLRLANFVPPDKLPDVSKVVAKGPAKTVKRVVDDEGFVRTVTKEVVTQVPPEVERALKAAGWTTITGTWKKKAENVYEVTNGKLETPKTNGALQVIVHKEGTAKVKVMVRNNQRDDSTYYSTYASTGFGFVVSSSAAKMYSAVGGYSYYNTGGVYKPYYERDVQLAGPKSKFMIQINDGKVEMYVNAKREHNSNYKLSKDGPFAIEVDGTATIESPQAAGQ